MFFNKNIDFKLIVDYVIDVNAILTHLPRGCNLLSFLHRCGTRLQEWDTQWNLNSLMKVC